MNILKPKIQLLINTIEPMRHKIKNLRSIAVQHAHLNEEDEANACIKKANTLQIKMEKAKKELDVLMEIFETKQVAEWEAEDATKAEAQKTELESADEEARDSEKSKEEAA